jgi:hypothetical protein
MIEAMWIGGIGLTAAAASYLHVYLGLALVCVMVLLALPVWGLSTGNPTVLLTLVAPAVAGLCLGRLLRRRQENL